MIVNGSSQIFTILVVIFKAKYSSNYNAVYNNLVALESPYKALEYNVSQLSIKALVYY